MNVLIIKDELPARSKLVSMLSVLDSGIRVTAQLGSVAVTLKWLQDN